MSLIITERLVQCYWPSWLVDRYIGVDPWTVEPIDFIEVDLRDEQPDYDERRVRFFMNMLMRGEMFDPIIIDCRWFGNHPGPPEIDDGHHRYVAAVLLGIERIPIDFGGVVRVLDWLTGRTQRPPVEAHA